MTIIFVLLISSEFYISAG